MSKIYLAFIEGGHAGLLANGSANPAATPGKETPYLKGLGRRVQEEEFNQPTAEYLRQELKKAGVHVYNPAPDSRDTPLKERTDFANKIYWQYCSKYGKTNVVAIYVSIHFNAVDGVFNGNDPSGFSVHIYKGQKGKEAGRLAQCIIDELKNGTKQVNRGIVEQDLAITRDTVMPAALSENGFMDNEDEAKLMIDPAFQKEVASEHAKGICTYFGIPYVSEQQVTASSQPTNEIRHIYTGGYAGPALLNIHNYLVHKGHGYDVKRGKDGSIIFLIGPFDTGMANFKECSGSISKFDSNFKLLTREQAAEWRK
jgi:N-acetylmuramoyl-L-alanine amidase